MAKKKINVKASRKERPVGVNIIAVLAYIGAAFTLLLGIFMIVASAAVSTILLKFAPEYAWLAGAGTAVLILLGIIVIAFAVLDYYIGRGLWNGKNWARIVVLIIAVLSGLGSFYPFNIGGIVINAVIIWYLGFNNEAVNYFK